MVHSAQSVGALRLDRWCFRFRKVVHSDQAGGTFRLGWWCIQTRLVVHSVQRGGAFRLGWWCTWSGAFSSTPLKYGTSYVPLHS